MKVGIIGTGIMGKPMAHNILKNGHELAVYARHPEKVKDLEAAGATFAGSPGEVGEVSECVLLSLPFDPEVEQIVLGENGVLSGAAGGTVIIDTTTGTPRSSRHIAAIAAEKGVYYLDAPVSGGVKGAENGTLTIMLGGEETAIEKVRPVFEAISKTCYVIGPVGAGRTLKALNQIMAGLNALVLSETVVLGKKAGISPETFLEVLGKSAADSYQLKTKLPQFIIPGKFDGGFRMELLIKDLDIAQEMAKELKAPAILTGLASQLYRAAASSGYAQKDMSSMSNFLGSFVGVGF